MKKKKAKETGDLFAMRVKAIRKKLKIKQGAFAEKVKISETQVSKIENGKNKPGHDFYYHIVKEFDVNLNYLFFGEEPMFRSSEQAPPAAASPLEKFRGEYTRENEEIDEFLHYFFQSDFFRFRIMSEAVRMRNDSADIIEDEINRKKSRENK